jgi:hypothetical protein
MAKGKTKPTELYVPPPGEKVTVEQMRKVAQSAVFIWLQMTHEQDPERFKQEAERHIITLAGWLLAAEGKRAALQALSVARKTTTMVAAERAAAARRRH